MHPMQFVDAAAQMVGGQVDCQHASDYILHTMDYETADEVRKWLAATWGVGDGAVRLEKEFLEAVQRRVIVLAGEEK